MAQNRNSVATPDNGQIQKSTPFQVMLRAMAMDASAEDQTFTGDDLNAILSAETEDELWEADNRGSLNFQHLAGCEIGIIDFNVKYSRGNNSAKIRSVFTHTDDEGQPRQMYLMVSCVRLSDAGEKSVIKLPPVGEQFEANTSARFVVAKLWRAMTMGLVNPNAGKVLECIVEETDLGGGEGVLKLRPIPKRVTRATAE
jgi:hypothetical protein